MKKKILPLGIALTTISPIVFIISCNQKVENKKIKVTPGSIAASTIGKAIDVIKKEEMHKNLQDLLENGKSEGLYLVKDFYMGKIYNPDKQFTHGKETWEESKNNFELIPQKDGWGRNQHVIELAKNDSLIMLYNDDDTDGLSQKQFTDNVSFQDTSLPIPTASPEILKINKEMGSIKFVTRWGYNIGFLEDAQNLNKGYLGSYIGSQSNHTNMTFNDAMDNLKNQVSENIFKHIQNYYSRASKHFIPQLVKNRIFEYEKIGKRLVKITFVGNNPITAATFSITPHGNATHIKHYGTYSISKADWMAYEKNWTKYFFMGRHV